ncbi:hypothetical protein C8J27_103290 [Rhodobacter aestuarii]|uniref:Uncharacterized protein n=1 Tax=Rhodobacter aestuarii TaxID=453582 RepID=A0A1N7JWI7_9RHOB|nr:hypothetical protein [Rhodobacter aestuarii]PTV95959.1 hypothetical protein C8J27_103290 [Rhodobacter aestuarii]SIS53687.1 hypothetical protein SAMN05421580_102145 [Rhodobacter aestuarii]
MSALLYRERSGWWASAFLGATALHGGALAAYFDVIPWQGWLAPPTPALTAEITVASLIVPEDQLAQLEGDGTSASDPVPPEAEPEPEAQPEPPPEPQVIPDPAPEPEPPPQVTPEPEPEALPEPEPTPEPEVTEPEPEPEPPVEPEPAPEPTAPPPEETANPLLPEEDPAGAEGGAEPGPGPGAPLPEPEQPEIELPPLELATVAPDILPESDPIPEPEPPAPEAVDPAPAEVPPAVSVPEPAAPVRPRLGEPIVAPPPPSPDAEALRRLVSRIRKQFGDSCLIALPQLGAGQAPSVVMLSDRDRSMVGYADAVLPDPQDPEADPISSRAVLVDNRQCPAVNFLRARGEYPAFGLSLGLVSTQVLSGGRLIGSIEGAPSGTQTALLLVDDNGVVQDLRRFLQFSGGKITFDVPVTRDGDARDTSQMLIALATPKRLDTVTNLAGRYAEDFFPALQKELGEGAAIAVLPFDLR